MVIETNFGTVEPDISVVELNGRLVLGGSAQGIDWKLESLVKDGARKIVVDVTRLTAIDSMGIGVLMMLIGRAQQNGGVVKIAGASGLVATTFRIVRMDRVVDMYESLDAACASFRNAAGAPA